MKRTAALLVLASILLLPQAPASAGGWWTGVPFYDQYIGIGESLTIKFDEALFQSLEAAEQAEGTDYFAYLVKSFDKRALDKAMSGPDPGDWWRPLSSPIRVGTVTLITRQANLMRGRVHLEVPDMATGRYSLMLCDSGCRTSFANHIPVPVNVTDDVLAAQTARRLDRVNQNLRLAVSRVRHEMRQTRRQFRQVEASSQEPSRTAPEAQPVAASDREDPAPWISYVGWFLAGALAASLLRRRRRQEPLEIPLETVPDDARELTRTP